MSAPDTTRLKRLRRLERLRESERLSAARHAAETAADHRRLRDLSARLAAMTSSAPTARHGAELSDRGAFSAALARLAATTAAEEIAAANVSTRAEQAMAQAQHRRDVTRDKARALGNAIGRSLDERQNPDLAQNVKGLSQERGPTGVRMAGRFDR